MPGGCAEPNADAPDRANEAHANLGPIQRCTVCHSTGGSVSAMMAPSLKGVYNRKIASTNFQQYSESFKALNKPGTNAVWDDASLKAFLLHPNQFIAGTTMPDLHLSQHEVDGIVETLMTL